MPTLAKSKGVLSDAEKAALVEATRSAAAVMVDDLAYLRRQVEDLSPSPGDVRRLSAIVRRLLIDGDLTKVAAPRIGRIELWGPDSRKLQRLNAERPFEFLAVGMHFTFGSEYWAIAMEFYPPNEPVVDRSDDAIPKELVPLRVDVFLNQKVIYFKGKSASRADVIKYVSNVAHGVHSGSPKEDSHHLIEKVRYIGTYDTSAENRVFHLNHSFIINQPTEAVPHVVDLSQIMLWNAVHFLVNSEDVLRLEEHVKLHG